MSDAEALERSSIALQSPLEIAGKFLDRAPVDLEGMSDALGLIVHVADNMHSDLSGMIVRSAESRSGFRIEVNGKHSHARQRFTLAHEIAHYLLHRDYIGDGIKDNALYRSDLSNKMEVEANSMAANILMPAQLIRRVYWAGLRFISGLSVAFGVSEEAMRIRLRQLRLGA